jgi:arsenite methyltransferase
MRERENEMSTVPTSDEQLRTEVQKRYAKTALQVLGATQETDADACCDTTCCTPGAESETHTQTITQVVPAEQSQSCCGPRCCGTGDGSLVTADLYSQAELGTIPVAAALASLGCGNPTALAERNRVESGIENVHFLKGIIEDIPLPDESVDVVISNCVINLSADKG